MKRAHVARYRWAAERVSGVVLDLACGWGMGTTILKDGGATSVLGVDADCEAIDYANSRTTDREHVQFLCTGLDRWRPPGCDWVVTLETIEHVENPGKLLRRWAEAARVGLIVSFPARKSVRQNQFHLHDIGVEEVDEWFEGRARRNGDAMTLFSREDGKSIPVTRIAEYRTT